jgi:spermidine/putrescine-binding protein
MSTLTMVVYEGWDDPEASAPFRREHGVKINPIYIDSDSDLLQAMRDGVGSIDLACIENRFTKIGVAENLIVPLDYGRLPNTGLYLDRIGELVRMFHDGVTWCAPYVWGTCPLAYNAKLVPSPPDSLNEFAAPEYAGKVAIRDEPSNQIIVWAKALGHEDPTRLTRSELDEVIDTVIRLKVECNAALVTLGPLLDRLVTGETWIASSAGWPGLSRLASERGADVRAYHPREGDHAWLDGWCILRDAPNEEAAHGWIDHMSGTEPQRIACNNLFCGTVNRETVDQLDPAVRDAYPHEDLAGVFANPGDFDLPPLEDAGERATLADWERGWDRVRAA